MVPEDEEKLSAQLWDAGTSGIEEHETRLCAYFEDTFDPEAIRRLFTGLEVAIERTATAAEVDLNSGLEPLLVGTRFVVVPADRIALPIDAAMAFGSGRHETTQLCLQALEECPVRGQTVFDVGCGSGILALAAEKLGAFKVVASDIDESAVQVAKRHFNGLCFAGSADCFESATADLVLSNITAKANDHIAADLKRITKPGGRILLSGFLTGHGPRHFTPDQVFEMGGWECWICDPASVRVPPGRESDPNRHDPRWWLGT